MDPLFPTIPMPPIPPLEVILKAQENMKNTLDAKAELIFAQKFMKCEENRPRESSMPSRPRIWRKRSHKEDDILPERVISPSSSSTTTIPNGYVILGILCMSALKETLEELYSGRKIGIDDLKMCTICGNFGHLPYQCRQEYHARNIQGFSEIDLKIKNLIGLLNRYCSENQINTLDKTKNPKEWVQLDYNPLASQLKRFVNQNKIKLKAICEKSIKEAIAKEKNDKIKAKLRKLHPSRVKISMEKEKVFNYLRCTLGCMNKSLMSAVWSHLDRVSTSNLAIEGIERKLDTMSLCSKFCSKCAQIGHLEASCTAPIYAQAGQEDVEFMKVKIQEYLLTGAL